MVVVEDDAGEPMEVMADIMFPELVQEHSQRRGQSSELTHASSSDLDPRQLSVSAEPETLLVEEEALPSHLLAVSDSAVATQELAVRAPSAMKTPVGESTDAETVVPKSMVETVEGGLEAQESVPEQADIRAAHETGEGQNPPPAEASSLPDPTKASKTIQESPLVEDTIVGEKTFSEGATEELQQEEAPHIEDKPSAEEEFPPITRRFNYASASVGAKVLSASPASKGVSKILNEDKDQYMLTECSIMDSWVDIELSEEILMNELQLGSFELFSSRVKEFEIFGSQKYPCKRPRCEWHRIGKFEGENHRHVQSFCLENPVWVRYIRLQFLSHFGGEHFCTLSLVRVHGSNLMEDFKSVMQRNQDDLELLSTTKHAGPSTIDDTLASLSESFPLGQVSVESLDFLDDYSKSSHASGSTLPPSNGSAHPASRSSEVSDNTMTSSGGGLENAPSMEHPATFPSQNDTTTIASTATSSASTLTRTADPPVVDSTSSDMEASDSGSRIPHHSGSSPPSSTAPSANGVSTGSSSSGLGAAERKALVEEVLREQRKLEEVLPGLIKETDISQLLDSVERMGQPMRGLEMKESIFKSLLNKVHRLELKNSIYIRILKRMHQEIEQKLAEQQELSESTTRMNQKFQARDWKLRNVLYRSERNCIERTDRSMEWSQRMFTWSIVAAVGVAVCVTLVLHFVLSFLWRNSSTRQSLLSGGFRNAGSAPNLSSLVLPEGHEAEFSSTSQRRSPRRRRPSLVFSQHPGVSSVSASNNGGVIGGGHSVTFEFQPVPPSTSALRLPLRKRFLRSISSPNLLAQPGADMNGHADDRVVQPPAAKPLHMEPIVIEGNSRRCRLGSKTPPPDSGLDSLLALVPHTNVTTASPGGPKTSR